ncbi:MAG: ParB N-terminal domain-containing protein, partial [Rhodospirillales bacterium]|nr:ParB N-terminal domain-containing protein [Rhodospirillales bacterium]
MSAKEVGPRLGRGLAALMGEAPKSAVAAVGISTIGVEMLEPSPYQPRGAMDPTSLAELVESVRASGILQPLLARPAPGKAGRYQIIAG